MYKERKPQKSLGRPGTPLSPPRGLELLVFQELLHSYYLDDPLREWTKYGPSIICGRKPLKNLKGYGLPKKTMSFKLFKRLSSTKFTWSILEYFIPFDIKIFWSKGDAPEQSPKRIHQEEGRSVHPPPHLPLY